MVYIKEECLLSERIYFRFILSRRNKFSVVASYTVHHFIQLSTSCWIIVLEFRNRMWNHFQKGDFDLGMVTTKYMLFARMKNEILTTYKMIVYDYDYFTAFFLSSNDVHLSLNCHKSENILSSREHKNRANNTQKKLERDTSHRWYCLFIQIHWNNSWKVNLCRGFHESSRLPRGRIDVIIANGIMHLNSKLQCYYISQEMRGDNTLGRGFIHFYVIYREIGGFCTVHCAITLQWRIEMWYAFVNTLTKTTMLASYFTFI